MNAVFEALSRASAFGLVALAVALIAQFALSQRAPAAWRAWIWRIALLQCAFALLPLAPIRWEVLAPPTAAMPTGISAPRAQSDEFSVANNLSSSPLELPDAAPIESAPLETQNTPIIESAPPISIAKTPAPFDWRALVLAIYALGIAFQCAQLLRGWHQLRRALRDCALNEAAMLAARLNGLAARMDLRTAPQLLISEGGSPFLIGIVRPRIVLPRALCVAEPGQLDAVLAHELAHLKRRDLIWLGATWLLQTLLWFHPLAWAARRFHGLETECACDELALRLAPIAPQSYGALLLNSMNNSKFSSPLAAGTCDTLFALKTRLLRLNNAPKKPRVMAKLAFAAALVLSCGALVPLKLVARAQNAAIVAPTKPNVAGKVVLQGVVKSKQTGQPLAGVPVTYIPILPKNAASNELFTVNGDGEFRDNWVEDMRPDLSNKQETVTDSRGYFRFNAISRDHLVLIDGEISALPLKYTEFSARQAVIIEMGKTGLKSDTEIELDEASQRTPKFALKTIAGNAVVQGVVTSKQTGKPLEGVPIILLAGNAKSGPKKDALADISAHQQTLTDARGYFRFNAAGGLYRLLIDSRIVESPGKISEFSAQRMDVFVAQQIYVVPLKDASMRNYQFELDEARSGAATPPPNNETLVSGQVVDETERPLAGAMVSIHQQSRRGPTSIKSDKNGRFVLKGLNSNERMSISSSLSGYGPLTYRLIKDGKNKVYTLSMPRASATLRGVVIGEDGLPARNFQVQPYGSVPVVKTNAQGRFLLPQIVPGATNVRVSTPNGGNGWGPISVRGGDQNVRIRLTHSISDARFPVIAAGPATSANSSEKTRALIGKTAPEIQSFRWANEKAAPIASLRGKVVLLVLKDFEIEEKSKLNDFARSFAATARVVGVQFNTGGLQRRDLKQRLDGIASQFVFPIALDETIGDGNPAGGATFSDYGFNKGGGYAVIGRDGKIIYAGDELNRAIQFASR